MLFRSRIVYPVTAPPIPDGAFLVLGGKIQWVGPWGERPGGSYPVVDFGDAILSPGWINAHCHLEYTHFAGRFPPGQTFTGWIQEILKAKKGSSLEEFRAARRRGVDQLIRTGTTTVADILSVADLWPERWDLSGIRCKPFWEMTGVLRGSEAQALVQDSIELLDSAPRVPLKPDALDAALPAGFSPHAPYSTLPSLLSALGSVSRERAIALTMHLSESLEEWECFTHRAGALFEWLRGVRSMDDCGEGSPIVSVERAGILGSNLLAAHVNYLGPDDARVLASRGVTVVHCPRSHAYFDHAPFPRAALESAGVAICLGTDSLASVLSDSKGLPELSMQAELRQWMNRDVGTRPEAAIELATVCGARALGMQGAVGELRNGAWADFVVTRYSGPFERVAEAMVEQSGPVASTWVSGIQVCPRVAD